MVIFTSWYSTMLLVLYYVTTDVFEEVQKLQRVGINPVKQIIDVLKYAIF